MPDQPPRDPPPPTPAAPLPPLLDYPSRQTAREIDTERWSDFFRALLVVFGCIAFLFFGIFGLCGLLGRGCG